MYLDENKRRRYLGELNRIGGINKCVLYNTGVFEYYNVAQNEVRLLCKRLEQTGFVKEVTLIEGKYDFSHFDFQKRTPKHKYTIRGILNENLD